MLYNGNVKGREWMKHMNNMLAILLVISLIFCGCVKDATVYNEQDAFISQDLTEQTDIHTEPTSQSSVSEMSSVETTEATTTSVTTTEETTVTTTTASETEATTTPVTTTEETTITTTTEETTVTTTSEPETEATTTQTSQATVTTTTEEAAPPTEKENDMKVIGYLTTWNYDCYKTLDWNNLTHINIAFVNPDTSGIFKNNIGNDATLKDIVNTAHKHGVKVLASLGGWGGSVNYPKLIATDSKMKSLNSNLLEFVKKFDLDGIDIDVEGDVDETLWTRYDAWMSSLRKMCDENSLLLTTACATWYAGKISDQALSLFDFVNIMVYDNTSEENHASMEYAKKSLDYFESRGIDKQDLVLGVPFYARTRDFVYMAYKNIIKADESAYNRDYYGEYSYNGKQMMEAKCELAKDYGGIMIWELGEDAPAPFSLLDVIGNNVLE